MKNIRTTKKNLLSLVDKNLQEMAMDFHSADRPHSDVRRDLERGETPHKVVPYPETGRQDQNFPEFLASPRYRQVVEKLRQYVPNAPPLNDTNVMNLTNMMMQAQNNIVRIERAHRRELEQLAVDLVIREMEIPEGVFQFDARIITMGEISPDEFNQELKGDEEGSGTEQTDEEDVEVEQELFNALSNLDIEKAKRRLINGIIQGASKRGHYMYSYVADELRQITGSNTLVNDYGILMSINDTLYWQLSNDMMRSMSGSRMGIGGQEEVDIQTDPPTIKARGANFPILVHELIKGVLEAYAVKGRSEDYAEVESEVDTLEDEIWDLRLGPTIWDKLRNAFPEEILTEDGKRVIQSWLLTRIFNLPAKKFLVFVFEILQGTDEGKRIMNLLLKSINDYLNNEDGEGYETPYDENFDEELDVATDNTTDDDLTNMLKQLGIKLDDETKENLGFDDIQMN